MVVEEILGVVKLAVPVPPTNTLPPLDAAYQSMVSPALGAATEMDAVPVPQIVAPDAPVGVEGTEFTVAVTVVLVAEIQPEVLFLASA